METESDYYQELSREAGFLHPHKETRCMCIGQQRQAYLRLVKAVSREALSSVRKHLVYIFYAHYRLLYKDPRGWLYVPLSLTLGIWLCYTHVANASSTHSPRTSLTRGASSACRVHTPFSFLLSYLSHWFVEVVFILWLQPIWPFDVGQRVSYLSVLLIVSSPDSLLLHFMPTGLLTLKVSWMLNFSSWAYSPVAASVMFIKSKGSRSICSFQIEDPLELYTLLLPSDLTTVSLLTVMVS